MTALRPFQQESLRRSKERYDSGINRQLLVLPTGCGKTVVFSNLIKHHGLTKKILVLVHREELAQQAADKILQWNPTYSVGIEMGDRRSDPSDRVVVASVQTLGREGSPRLLQFEPATFSAVVCDEAHHSVSPSYKTIFSHFGFLDGSAAGRLLLGVTATPGRGDGQALAQVYDEIVYNYPMLQATREGWLCPLRGLRIRTQTSLDGVDTVAGDFNQSQLSTTVNTPARNKVVVDEWLGSARDRQSIVFTVDIAHAVSLSNAFKARGVRSEAIWGADPNRTRKLAAHRAGELEVLTNCGVLIEGYDDWRIRCVVIARPTKSQLLFVQMAGRGTRLPEGINNLVEARAAGISLPKDDCLLLDVTDNSSRHSLVTLASIFGLPPKMDLKGKSIVDAVDLVEAAQMTKPDLDLSGCEDLDSLESYLEEVDLFTVKFPPEVEENSEYQWHPTPAGNYVLVLPNRERVAITQNILGQWHVEGCVDGTRFAEYCGSREEAFAWADSMIRRFGRKLVNLLRRQPKNDRAKLPITPEQQLALTTFLKKRGKPLPDFQRMSKHDASSLLIKLFARQNAATTDLLQR